MKKKISVAALLAPEQKTTQSVSLNKDDADLNAKPTVVHGTEPVDLAMSGHFYPYTYFGPRAEYGYLIQSYPCILRRDGTIHWYYRQGALVRVAGVDRDLVLAAVGKRQSRNYAVVLFDPLLQKITLFKLKEIREINGLAGGRLWFQAEAALITWHEGVLANRRKRVPKGKFAASKYVDPATAKYSRSGRLIRPKTFEDEYEGLDSDELLKDGKRKKSKKSKKKGKSAQKRGRKKSVSQQSARVASKKVKVAPSSPILMSSALAQLSTTALAFEEEENRIRRVSSSNSLMVESPRSSVDNSGSGASVESGAANSSDSAQNLTPVYTVKGDTLDSLLSQLSDLHRQLQAKDSEIHRLKALVGVGEQGL